LKIIKKLSHIVKYFKHKLNYNIFQFHRMEQAPLINHTFPFALQKPSNTNPNLQRTQLAQPFTHTTP